MTTSSVLVSNLALALALFAPASVPTPAPAPVDAVTWCVRTPAGSWCGAGPVEIGICIGEYCASCSSDDGLLRCSLSTPTHECSGSCGSVPGSCSGSCEPVG